MNDSDRNPANSGCIGFMWISGLFFFIPYGIICLLNGNTGWGIILLIIGIIFLLLSYFTQKEYDDEKEKNKWD
ncbi:energy-converting hydrogenase Eha subunit H [Parabacteroides sp. PF5-5]|uniref:hypothetical protein n=1 Tax=unclassified Parabacteroides TaxID=2649774 RepID=UPI00247710D7|nr:MULTISPECIES: hypothetical protein [unclassified Parabacteroides]MDH6306270.1 energy-converting hydrogenase Eha subunit H [Parabacteroides sp. PH5-39]MDH6316939.1 energy-converting hydrogenase Eha subunit H [Parabacteroides sp. PF5-13]MDH6321008.1 energy-converting hydrogenase Eha subunit H [Parabacteroides sp. PH5-13]MDH6324740.1 energy-converting hydrogenase Eha subunit H [Parabacteroides sp. PH5-8]MDH6328124.1 energy-converting hydrogenase Eha subunit H [Parabacteroides sp. PH5-41]